MYFAIIWIIEQCAVAVVLWCYAELLIYAVPGSASFPKSVLRKSWLCRRQGQSICSAWRPLLHGGCWALVPYLLTSPGSGQLWAGEAAAAAAAWPPLVTSPDIWLHNWDNNSSGGKHLIKTLCSIWTAEYCKLFTQLEGSQKWTLRGFVFTRFINIYSHLKIFST